MVLTFDSASAFTFSWLLDGQYGSEPFQTGSGASCPSVGGTPTSYSGAWANPAESGWGFSVTAIFIYAAKWFLAAGDVVANASGYAVGLIVSFTLNSRWTFSYTGPRQAAALKFLGVAAVAYRMNLLTVLTAIEMFRINAYLAQALGVPSYTLTSFLLSKYFVFQAPAPLGTR